MLVKKNPTHPTPKKAGAPKLLNYTASLNHNEPIYVYTFIFTYLFSYFGGLQILWIRLLAKMLRENSSKRQKYTILHTYQLRKKSEGQTGLFRLSSQGGTEGEKISATVLRMIIYKPPIQTKADQSEIVGDLMMTLPFSVKVKVQ